MNLIGEHTDYNGGLVLPMALDLACYAASGPSAGGVEVWSENLGSGRRWTLDELASPVRARDWTDYVAGVACELIAAGLAVLPRRILFHSTVPVGGGLSSSASLEVAAALALTSPGIAPERLVAVCHAAENNFVGLPCGVMDQFVSVHARAGAALEIDCRDLSSRPVPIPEGLAVVVVNSGVRHELADSAYGIRVAECREAERLLGVQSLRDASIQDLGILNGVSLLRARHVVSENRRVRQFHDAACAGDGFTMGRLMVESHRSLQKDYQVSCEELDFLVSTALSVQGVLGARMTGGGFGGSTVNLMPEKSVSVFEERILGSYHREFGNAPQVHRVTPSAGACRIF